jgi:hypothetical protein
MNPPAIADKRLLALVQQPRLTPALICRTNAALWNGSFYADLAEATLGKSSLCAYRAKGIQDWWMAGNPDRRRVPGQSSSYLSLPFTVMWNVRLNSPANPK